MALQIKSNWQIPMDRKNDKDAQVIYTIKVSGRLDSSWSDWFGGFEITTHDEETILTGSVPDQAALHGVLVKIGELGLVITCVKRSHQDDKDDAAS